MRAKTRKSSRGDQSSAAGYKNHGSVAFFLSKSSATSSVQMRRSHAELDRSTASRTLVVVELLTGGWSARSESVGLKNFQTGYWPYNIYDAWIALLHDIK